MTAALEEAGAALVRGAGRRGSLDQALARDVTVVVPFSTHRADERGELDHHYRDTAWLYCRAALWEPWLGRDRIVECSASWRGRWSKGASILAGLEQVATKYVIMADADVLVERHAIEGSLRVLDRGAPWVIPHQFVRRLTQAGADQVYRTVGLDPFVAVAHAEAIEPHRGMAGGGMLLALVSTLRRVPPDPRFAGWGQEDEAWARALTTLAGAPVRGQAMMQHLWHPPAQRVSRHTGSRESAELYDRYCAAHRDRTAMAALLDEFKGEAGQ